MKLLRLGIICIYCSSNLTAMADVKVTVIPPLVTITFWCADKNTSGTSKGWWQASISNADRIDVTSGKPTLYHGCDDSKKPTAISELLYNRLLEWVTRHKGKYTIKSKLKIHIEYPLIVSSEEDVTKLEKALRIQFEGIGKKIRTL